MLSNLFPTVSMSLQRSLCSSFLVAVLCITIISAASSTQPTNGSTTTQTPAMQCANAKACDECVKQISCVYCTATETCQYYKTHSGLFPSAQNCPLGDLRWHNCWLNVLALIITMGILAFALLVVLPTWFYCYCCYCPRRRNLALARTEQRLQAEHADRRVERAIKNTERQHQRNQIREKYGLPLKDGNGYSKLEDSK